MNAMLVKLFYLMSVIIALNVPVPLSAEDTHENIPPQVNWSFNGPFGTFDRASMQRGFQIYIEVCSTCHGLDHLRYGNLTALGFSDAEVKAIAAKFKIPGPPNDEGQPTEVKATPGDYFARPFPNDQAARAANNGSLPPDLSLITKARKYGPDYVFAILTGYSEPPENFKLLTGMHYNEYYSGHQIAMPPPLTDNQVTYADGTPATVQQMAHDVTVFLSWAAEPEMEHRKQLGIKVLIYLFAFTFVMYLLMRKTWRRLEDKS